MVHQRERVSSQKGRLVLPQPFHNEADNESRLGWNTPDFRGQDGGYLYRTENVTSLLHVMRTQSGISIAPIVCTLGIHNSTERCVERMTRMEASEL